MPWRGPVYEGEFPTLGYAVLEWIEEMLVVPDGDHLGERFSPTREQAEFTIRLFRVQPGQYYPRLANRGGLFMGPKGMGKSPFAAALGWAFAKGPVVPDGWDANGEPVGRPVATPWIQFAALAHDQTINTWSSVLAMADPGNGARLCDHFPDIDLGLTRVMCAGGGRLETVTSEAGTREGQRVTAAIEDESGLWRPSNGGSRLSRTLHRNVAKMGGLWVQTTNAYVPGESSVAELTHDAAGKTGDVVVLHMQGPKVEKLADRRKLKTALRTVYGDSARFADLDRIVAECNDPANDEAESRRFYLNELYVGADQWIDPEVVDSAGVRGVERAVEPGETIALGFDGSDGTVGPNRADSTVLYGCRLSDGHLFVVGMWEHPAGETAWEVPRAEVRAAVAEAFDTYRIPAMLCDPPWWRTEIDEWSEAYGRDIVMRFETSRDQPMAAALERLHTGLRSGDFSLDGDARARSHFVNARRLVKRAKIGDSGEWRQIVLVRKERPMSPLKIDSVVAAALAAEARAVAIARGARATKTYGFATFR